MGCFLGCFGSSNDQKRKKRQRYKVILRDQKPTIQDLLKADASLGQNITNSFPEPREKTEVPVALSLKRRKKVTFDTNVTTYEHIQVYDSTESLLEKNEKGETLSDSEIKGNIPNYRYGNCLESDDEFEDVYQEDYDFDDNDDDLDDDVEEDKSSVWDSLDSDKNTVSSNGYVLSVLSPVENITQWQALKSRGRTQKALNCKGEKEILSLNYIPLEPNNWKQEAAAVDSSLSNWLISSEINSMNMKPIC